MSTIRYDHRHLDVACELERAEAGARATEWQRLREAGLGTDRIPCGVRLWLPSEELAAANDLARREASCCGFLDLELVHDGDSLHLDVTSLAPTATAVIACLTGLDAACALPCC